MKRNILHDKFIFYLIIFPVIYCQEITVRMSSDLPMSIGDDLTVQCRVDDFPPGAAVVWWKRQGEEEVKLGENNVLDVDISRYDLLVNQATSSMIFYLNIRGKIIITLINFMQVSKQHPSQGRKFAGMAVRYWGT